MATILVSLCIRYNKKNLIFPSVLLGFGTDLYILFLMSNLLS